MLLFFFFGHNFICKFKGANLMRVKFHVKWGPRCSHCHSPTAFLTMFSTRTDRAQTHQLARSWTTFSGEARKITIWNGSKSEYLVSLPFCLVCLVVQNAFRSCQVANLSIMVGERKKKYMYFLMSLNY